MYVMLRKEIIIIIFYLYISRYIKMQRVKTKVTTIVLRYIVINKFQEAVNKRQ